MTNEFVTITKTLVKRGWSDVEPKLVFALISGSAAVFVEGVANAYHVHLPPNVENALPLVLAVLGGYLTPSVGTTITHSTSDTEHAAIRKEETHSGNTVSTVTGPTLIQAPAVPPRGAAFLANLPSAAQDSGQHDGETAVIADSPVPADRLWR